MRELIGRIRKMEERGPLHFPGAPRLEDMSDADLWRIVGIDADQYTEGELETILQDKLREYGLPDLRINAH